MKALKTALPVVLTLIAGAAAAEGWTHASPGLGQHEGRFSAEDDAFAIDYTCSPSSSQIGFRAKGLHIAAGESTIAVDGETLLTANTTYNSKWDATSVTQRVEAEWGDQLKDAHNALIMAIARGSEAVWTTPSGQTFTFNLSGSADIKHCAIH